MHEILAGKTATLATFQRVRGMLRLLARTVRQLWNERPADATAIHVHHIDPCHEPIHQEILTRLGQDAFAPALSSDISAPAGKRSLAQEIDAVHHAHMPRFTECAARTIFMHTLADNELLKGLAPDHLRYSMLGPTLDISFIEQARRKSMAESAYLDDRPAAPLRFLAEANLSQIIRREEQHVDSGERLGAKACGYSRAFSCSLSSDEQEWVANGARTLTETPGQTPPPLVLDPTAGGRQRTDRGHSPGPVGLRE